MMEMMDMTYAPHIRVAHWNTSKYAVVSSGFFLVPAVYSYTTGLTYFTILSLLTAIISANYWKNAICSWERIVDRIFARMSFIVYFSNGMYYVRTPTSVISSFITFITFTYFYYLSNKYEKTDTWWKYHMAFHLLACYTQCIILNSIVC